MSLEYTINFYDTRSLDWRNRLIGYFSKTNITHCGLEVSNGTLATEYAVIEKHRGISAIKPHIYHRLIRSPLESFKLGAIDSTLPTVPDDFKISWIHYVFYHFIGKFINAPMPDSCATFVSSFLMDIGILNKKIFYPEDLYKELEHADNFNLWERKSR
jgi:hypothetical protein